MLFQCLLAVTLLILFHSAIRNAFVSALAVPGRFLEAAEKSIEGLLAWVNSCRPLPADRHTKWREFQGFAVGAIACYLGYVEFLVLSVAFQFLLPERYAEWLALSGAALSALVGYGCHAAPSKRFRALTFAVSAAFVIFAGVLAGLRAHEMEAIQQTVASIAAYDEQAAVGAGIINDAGAATPAVLAPHVSAPRTPSDRWSKKIVLSAGQAVLYAVGEQCAVYLAIDLAGPGFLALFLLPFRGAVALPFAAVHVINVSGILRLPGVLAGWICSAAAEVAQWLKAVPGAVKRDLVRWREHRIRAPFEEERLRAGLQAEQEVHRAYLRMAREARIKFLQQSLHEQLERQLAVHKEAIASRRGQALVRTSEQDERYTIPSWARLQEKLEGKSKQSFFDGSVN
jgi:hypothetical protein